MRILILGGTAMLGHKLVQILSKRNDVWTTIRGSYGELARYGIFDRERTLENIEASDFNAVRRAIDKVMPDVIVNSIGIIKQVPSAKDVVQSLTINSILPQKLAEIAKRGPRLVTISTDCVFDGRRGSYTELDPPNALDLYGTSKRFGEVLAENCITLRTSIIGRELRTAHSLVEWFLCNRGRTVKGFSNAIYTGFPTLVFADIIDDLLTEHVGLEGLFHVSSRRISKFDLLRIINDKFAAKIEITKDTELVLDRSLDSSRYQKATGFRPADWAEMIERMAADPTPYETWRN
ncbi:MAG: SDR family oxidoreductase [Acidobacteriota bacterium]